MSSEVKAHFSWLAASVLVSLSFVQVFTVNFGFPFKLYELAIIVWSMSIIPLLPRSIVCLRIITCGILFISYAVITLFYNTYIVDDVGVYLKSITSFTFDRNAAVRQGTLYEQARFSPFLDGILKCGYVLLCVLGLELIARNTMKSPQRAVKIWMAGACVALLVHFTLLVFSYFNIPFPNLPGLLLEPYAQAYISVNGVSLYRAGTFIEGNHAAPFYVLSFIIAWANRYIWLAVLFFLATFGTFSTIGIIALVCVILRIMWNDRRRSGFYSVGVIVVMLFLGMASGIIQNTVIDKLMDSDARSSLHQRMATTTTALQMFFDHPILGIGMDQFGMHVEGEQQWTHQGTRADTALKPIPNNVYVQLLAEQGAIGALLFLALLWSVVREVRYCTSPILRFGVVVVFVMWLATPTFTMMYYWAFLGLVVGVARSRQIKITESIQV